MSVGCVFSQLAKEKNLINFYSFFWCLIVSSFNNTGTSLSFSPLLSGSYMFVVIDANGCVDSTVINFTSIPNSILEFGFDSEKRLLKILDVLGREVVNARKNVPIFYIYDDGTVEKKYLIK